MTTPFSFSDKITQKATPFFGEAKWGLIINNKNICRFFTKIIIFFLDLILAICWFFYTANKAIGKIEPRKSIIQQRSEQWK